VFPPFRLTQDILQTLPQGHASFYGGTPKASKTNCSPYKLAMYIQIAPLLRHKIVIHFYRSSLFATEKADVAV